MKELSLSPVQFYLEWMRDGDKRGLALILDDIASMKDPFGYLHAVIDEMQRAYRRDTDGDDHN